MHGGHHSSLLVADADDDVYIQLKLGVVCKYGAHRGDGSTSGARSGLGVLLNHPALLPGTTETLRCKVGNIIV